jgi:hypothetical protein
MSARAYHWPWSPTPGGQKKSTHRRQRNFSHRYTQIMGLERERDQECQMRHSLEKRLTDNGFSLLSSLGQWTWKTSKPCTRSLTVKPGSSQQKSFSLEFICVHLWLILSLLSIRIPPQVVGQRSGRIVSPLRLLLRALQDDDLHVAGNPGLAFRRGFGCPVTNLCEHRDL